MTVTAVLTIPRGPPAEAYREARAQAIRHASCGTIEVFAIKCADSIIRNDDAVVLVVEAYRDHLLMRNPEALSKAGVLDISDESIPFQLPSQVLEVLLPMMPCLERLRVALTVEWSLTVGMEFDCVPPRTLRTLELHSDSGGYELPSKIQTDAHGRTYAVIGRGAFDAGPCIALFRGISPRFRSQITSLRFGAVRSWWTPQRLADMGALMPALEHVEVFSVEAHPDHGWAGAALLPRLEYLVIEGSQWLNCLERVSGYLPLNTHIRVCEDIKVDRDDDDRVMVPECGYGILPAYPHLSQRAFEFGGFD